MAAPHVSGAAALAWSLVPNATYTQVHQAILAGVDKLATLDPAGSGNTPVATGGRLNAIRTLGNLAMVVTASTPEAGSVDAGLPKQFEVTFSFPVASIASNKPLLVNGTAATSSLPVSDRTVKYSFNTSPVTHEGVQTMSLPEGAATAAGAPIDGTASKAWAATFRYTTMRVVTTAPAGSAAVPLPLTSLAVTFSNEYDANTVDATDLILNRGSVDSISPAGADTVVYNLKGVDVGEGILTVEMRTGAVQDSNGNPVLPFSTEIDLDFGGPADVSTPLTSISPLQPVGPLGGLVYESSVSARISPNRDKDVFTIDLDPGQTISVVVDPAGSLKPVVTLVEPGDASTPRSRRRMLASQSPFNRTV